jgi:hypothetical protein
LEGNVPLVEGKFPGVGGVVVEDRIDLHALGGPPPLRGSGRLRRKDVMAEALIVLICLAIVLGLGIFPLSLIICAMRLCGQRFIYSKLLTCLEVVYGIEYSLCPHICTVVAVFLVV